MTTIGDSTQQQRQSVFIRCDDDGDVFTLSHFSEILPVVRKQAVTKYIYLITIGGRKRTTYEILRTSVPVREGNGINELR